MITDFFNKIALQFNRLIKHKKQNAENLIISFSHSIKCTELQSNKTKNKQIMIGFYSCEYDIIVRVEMAQYFIFSDVIDIK